MQVRRSVKELRNGKEKKNGEVQMSNNEREKRSKLKLAFLLFLVAVLSISTATLAWFTLNSFTNVGNLEMSVGTSAELKVSTANHGTDLSKYTNKITKEMIDSLLAQQNTSLSEMQLDPVTSSDGLKFYTEFGDQRSANTGGYLQFDLYFISTESMWIHLTSEDSSSGEGDGTSVKASTNTTPSADESVRISFAEPGGSTSIYEPQKGSFAVAGQSTFTLQSTMNYSNSTRVFHLDELSPKKITVCVWIEGEDPECINAIQKAQLEIQMCFRGTNDSNQPVG